MEDKSVQHNVAL